MFQVNLSHVQHNELLHIYMRVNKEILFVCMAALYRSSYLSHARVKTRSLLNTIIISK
jgi:hypothetical protein